MGPQVHRWVHVTAINDTYRLQSGVAGGKCATISVIAVFLLLVGRAAVLGSRSSAPADTDMPGFRVTQLWPFDEWTGRLGCRVP